MKYLVLFSCVVFSVFMGAPLTAQAVQGKAPVVMELFTFPACGAFEQEPEGKFVKNIPAELFAKIAIEGEGIIPLTCSIDNSSYEVENRIERAKTVDAFCRDRNYFYYSRLNFNDHVGGSKSVVVHGEYETHGEMENVVRSAIDFAGARNDTFALTLNLNDGTLYTDIPAFDLGDSINLMVIGYQDEGNIAIDLPSDLGIPTVYVVNAFKVFEAWEGHSINLAVPFSDLNGAPAYSDGFVIIVQNDETGEILAAGSTGIQ